MQNVLNHVQTDSPILLANAEKNFQRSVRVLFTLAKVEDISFDTLVSNHQSLELLHILHVN